MVDATLVAATLIGRLKERYDDLVGQTGSHDPPAHGQHVGIVVLAGHAGCEQVVAQRGSDARHLVGGDLLALSGSAEHDAALGIAPHHGPADGRAVGGVVDGLGAVGTDIAHGVAEAGQHRRKVGLEVEAGVVSADGDPHGILRWS